ncbi:replication-associated protein [Crucivirus-234]|nr:replication-associated protein [Crucivirus-211]QMW68721.1 replication-associated protein [Crucivirus-234]
MSRSRNWCYTINNPTNEEIETCDVIECSYNVFGFEVGNEGTPHLQGYIEFKDAKTLRSAKKSLGGRAHLEQRRGTATEASDYCKKDNLFIENGSISNQGKRNDLDTLAELVKTKGIKGVIEEAPGMFIKFGKNIERLSEFYMKPRTTAPKVIWLWGKAGVGKTKLAHENIDNEDIYIWNQTKWWTGYRQQSRVIIDDYSFDNSDHHYRYLLQLIDRYSIQVETKGGMVYFNSPEIYITCEFPPTEFWQVGNKLDQITRRISEIVEVKDVICKESNDIITLVPPELEPSDNIDEDWLDI